MKSARYYEELQRNTLKCNLCPHHCVIGEGKQGICRVRKNTGGELFLETYGVVSSVGFDPIEKKPLYHFHPGSVIFSVGSFGCNLRCKFCQNWEISQEVPNGFNLRRQNSPESLVASALENKSNIGIAFTYNEPTVWFEYMADIAEISRKKGLKNVMVTNGFINREPLAELTDLIDAFNVDLKAFTDDFYKQQTFSKLEPVKETLRNIRKSGRHLEITNLVITGLNDNVKDFAEMVKWISGELGRNTVLHLSRYFPTYKTSAAPTPAATLEEFHALASQSLDYVYLGNITSTTGQDTKCPKCGAKVINRSRYDTWVSGLDKEGNCKKCGFKILDHI